MPATFRDMRDCDETIQPVTQVLLALGVVAMHIGIIFCSTLLKIASNFRYTM